MLILRAGKPTEICFTLVATAALLVGCAGADSRKASAPTQVGGGADSARSVASFAADDASIVVELKLDELHKTTVYSALIGIARDQGLASTFRTIESQCGLFWPHVVNEAMLSKSAKGNLAALALGIGETEAVGCLQRAFGATPYLEDQGIKLLRAEGVFIALVAGKMLIGDRLAVTEAVRTVPKVEARPMRDPLRFRADLADSFAEHLEGTMRADDKSVVLDGYMQMATKAEADDLVGKFSMFRRHGKLQEALSRQLLDATDLVAEGKRIRFVIKIEGEAKVQAKLIDLLVELIESVRKLPPGLSAAAPVTP
jgi:hypothetical protein